MLRCQSVLSRIKEGVFTYLEWCVNDRTQLKMINLNSQALPIFLVRNYGLCFKLPHKGQRILLFNFTRSQNHKDEAYRSFHLSKSAKTGISKRDAFI